MVLFENLPRTIRKSSVYWVWNACARPNDKQKLLDPRGYGQRKISDSFPIAHQNVFIQPLVRHAASS